ncbi:MAG: hypothetical protein V9G12_03910 [Microthrixaceae bacterium]
MQELEQFDQKLLEMLNTIAGEGIKNAAEGFSGMTGHKIEVSNPVIELAPLLTIPKVVGDLEDDAVGVYLRFEGDMPGQIMMIIPFHKALELADLIMGLDSGTTKH